LLRPTDAADVLYNKFNVDFSTLSNNIPPQHPNTDYSCVVATTDGQWRASHCTELHRVVCQSDTLTGINKTCFLVCPETIVFGRT